MNDIRTASHSRWPELPLDAWRKTCDTLHMYSQIVGKIRLALAPPEPEWAHVSLYVTSRGLTTSPMPLADRTFQIDFDFIAHKLDVNVTDGQTRSLNLEPRSVADFYQALMGTLGELGIDVAIKTMPQEVPSPIPFPEDRVHTSYDPPYVNRFWQILVRADAIFKEHRAPFRGRHTLVQFFWGTFDLAYARFSGRTAEPPPNANLIMRNSMDAQEICAGFWAGDDRFPEPAFWCYAYPQLEGLERAAISPSASFWSPEMGLFVLRYEDARRSKSPGAAVREFLSSTYDACATLASWDRSALNG